jgi:hypothetical protein
MPAKTYLAPVSVVTAGEWARRNPDFPPAAWNPVVCVLESKISPVACWFLIQGVASWGTPAEFRQKAHERVELASKTENAVHRKVPLSLAVKWLQLADAMRHDIDLTTNTDKQSAA